MNGLIGGMMVLNALNTITILHLTMCNYYLPLLLSIIFFKLGYLIC